MAATVQILAYNGAGPTSTQIDGSAIRYKLADNNTVDTNNPIPVPPSGSTFSWRKHTKINVTASPAGSISNLRWFSTVPANVGNNFYAWSSATYTQGTSGDQAGVVGFTDSGNKATNLIGASNRSSTTPLTLNGGATIISNPTTGLGTQDYVVTQMEIASTYVAGPGSTGAVTCTYRWSET